MDISNVEVGEGHFEGETTIQLSIGGRCPAPLDEAEEGERRAQEWNSSLKPWDVFELFLVAQAAANSLRVENAQQHERVVRHLQAQSAVVRWDAERRDEAEDLGLKLAAKPGKMARRLARTRHGCEWLLGTWQGLGAILDARGAWDERQEGLAMDLLGIPAELRDGPTPLDADLDGRKALVASKVSDLSAALVGGLVELDKLERAAAEHGFGPDAGGALAAVRRHERFCVRRFEYSVDRLKKNRVGYHPDGPSRGPGVPSHHQPTPPAPAPVPRPAPKSTDQLMAETRALAARKQAAAPALVPEPTPTPVPSPAPGPAHAPEATPAPVLIVPTPLPVPTLTPKLPSAPLNRRGRRALLARARRGA